jgi:hypothetical protein
MDMTKYLIVTADDFGQSPRVRPGHQAHGGWDCNQRKFVPVYTVVPMTKSRLLEREVYRRLTTIPGRPCVFLAGNLGWLEHRIGEPLSTCKINRMGGSKIFESL